MQRHFAVQQRLSMMVKSQGDLAAAVDLRLLSALVSQPPKSIAGRIKDRLTPTSFLASRRSVSPAPGPSSSSNSNYTKRNNFLTVMSAPRRTNGAKINTLSVGDVSRSHSRSESFSEHWLDWLGSSVENLVADRRNALTQEQRLPPPTGLKDRIKRGS